MKLLLIVDRVDYPYAVNPQLAYRLAEQLSADGHTVALLELWDGSTPLPPLPQALTRTDLTFAGERQMNEALEHGNADGSPTPVRLARLLRHPLAVRAAVNQLVLRRPERQTACRAALEKLDREGFDAMVAVCAPYHAAFALAEAQVKAKKALWMLDPYSILQDPNAQTRCRELYAAMDALFPTRQMAEDFTGPELAPKTQVLAFPCLTPPPVPDEPQRYCMSFVGNLYPEIRTPHFALELFCALNDPHLSLVFAGGGWEHYPEDFTRPYRKILGDRLQIPGPLPPEEAVRLSGRAEYLLNLGNARTNQLPSKIFEYFASGKPVLNLCKNPRDPALPYFERYPLALTLFESDGTGPEVQMKLARWLNETAGQRLPFETVARLYYENTPPAVAKAMAARLEAL